MARKRSKKKPERPEAPRSLGREDLRTTLADQLGDALRARKDELVQRPPEPEPAPEPAHAPRRLTEGQLMAEAFAAVSEGAALPAKFAGRGYDPGEVEIVGFSSNTTSDEAPTADDALTEEDLVFLEAMTADVDRLDDGRRSLVEKEWVGAAWHTVDQLERFSPRQLGEIGLTGAQRALLKRSRRCRPMQVLNLRRERAARAMSQLDAFVRGCRARRERFVRIVHGKGRGSKGAPVLKPAVVEWCETDGAALVLGWAPETDQSGQYGSVVLELATRRRRG